MTIPLAPDNYPPPVGGAPAPLPTEAYVSAVGPKRQTIADKIMTTICVPLT